MTPITDKTIRVGSLWGANWYFEWGRVGIWQPGEWAVEVHYPYIRWKRWAGEIFFGADTALRINWREKAVAVQVLGLGVAVSLSPDRYSMYRKPRDES